MRRLGTWLSFMTLLLTSFWGSAFSLNLPDKYASTTTWHYIYLPVVMKNYKSPPPFTISHYISWGQSDLTYQKFYDMGKTLGESVSAGFWGYVILQFGEPWKEGQIYKVLDYDNYVAIPISDIQTYVMGYLSGFYHNSPSDAFLIASIGITNQGPYFSPSNDSMGFGQAWGTMITNVVNWINTAPSYAGKVDVFGGIDNELSWNNGEKSAAWKSGYIETASRPYLYYGDCNSCPYYAHTDWTPASLGWTLEQVYAMANTTSGLALPQIYRKDRQHAEQWYYLSLYMYLQEHEPIGFMGSLTESSACSERGGCYSGTPDAINNLPGEGWEQLWGKISSDPRTAQSLIGIPFDLPVSTDISWDHWKVRFTP